MEDYKKLLKRGIEKIPEKLTRTERFEIPKVVGHIEGNKTIITNFNQIASSLHRDPQQLLKFLLRELATPGILEKNRLILGRKISSSKINEKIQLYTKTFVLCPECKKPDTQLMKENKILSIKCTACGAKHTVRAKI